MIFHHGISLSGLIFGKYQAQSTSDIFSFLIHWYGGCIKYIWNFTLALLYICPVTCNIILKQSWMQKGLIILSVKTCCRQVPCLTLVSCGSGLGTLTRHVDDLECLTWSRWWCKAYFALDVYWVWYGVHWTLWIRTKVLLLRPLTTVEAYQR